MVGVGGGGRGGKKGGWLQERERPLLTLFALPGNTWSQVREILLRAVTGEETEANRFFMDSLHTTAASLCNCKANPACYTRLVNARVTGIEAVEDK